MSALVAAARRMVAEATVPLLAIASVIALGHLAGCRTRLLDLPDVPALPVDGAMSADLAGPAVCVAHALAFQPLSELRLLAPSALDPGQVAFGSILRVQLSIPLRACDVVGEVLTRVMPGNATDLVVVTARIWKGNIDCGPPVTTVYRVATVLPDQGLGSPRVIISDGAPGATAAKLTVMPEPRPAADCALVKADGDLCQLDCQCTGSAGLRCILDTPMPPSGRCSVPCEEDADCPPSRAHCNVSGDATCEPGSPEECRCPPSQTCSMGGGCVARVKTDLGACRCDGDCGAGEICNQAQCIVPCTTDHDCAGGQRCVDAACLTP